MDLISRQAAIDAFDLPIYNIKGKENAERVVEYLKAVLQRIKELPSAEPERKRGWWIKQPYKSDKYVIFRCSECLKESGFGHVESKWANFCPNCGARMKDEEE